MIGIHETTQLCFLITSHTSQYGHSLYIFCDTKLQDFSIIRVINLRMPVYITSSENRSWVNDCSLIIPIL